MVKEDKEKREAQSPDDGEVRIIKIAGSEPEPSAEKPATPEEPDPLEQLKARVAELEDLRLRALAETDNTRKRLHRQMDDALRSANDRLLADILEVVDNFERALKHVNGDAAAEHNVAGIREGTELIYNQLMGLLGRYDVRPMEAVGRPFDPVYHEALAHIESRDFGEGIVAAEINRGYMVGSRVLRHARVAVSKGAPEVEQKED